MKKNGCSVKKDIVTFDKTPVVVVEWEDAAFTDKSGMTAKEIHDRLIPFMQRSVGFLLRKDQKIIIIAQSQNAAETDDEGEVTFNDVLQIPMGMVRKVTRLGGA